MHHRRARHDIIIFDSWEIDHMSKSKTDRRGFLRGAAGVAALAAQSAQAQQALAKPQQTERSSPAETGAAVEVKGNEKPGSDFMIDVLKTLGIEYCAANPGSSFR